MNKAKMKRHKDMTGYDGLVVAVIYKAIKDKDSRSPTVASAAKDWLKNGGLTGALHVLDCFHIRGKALRHLDLD